MWLVMKKILASLLSAVLALSAVMTVSAASTANPWKDSSVHVMEIENYDSGYPTGDISTFPQFWSYNQEIGFAPAGGTLKNGQLVINSSGTDSFFFKRAKGVISSSLLQKADGIGFYIKNGTKSAFRCSFYGIGDKDSKNNGAAMFFFKGKSAQFVDMQGNQQTLTLSDDLVTIPKGAEGYLMFDFDDFVDGWHDNVKLDLSKTDLHSLGYRLNDAVVSVRYTVTLDHVFLYGKNISHVPGTISMKTTTPEVSSTASKVPTNTSSQAASKVSSKVTPVTSQPDTPAVVSEDESAVSELTSSEELILSESSEELIASAESDSSSSEIAADNEETENRKISPIVPILIIAIILVLAVGAIAVIAMMKKKKETTGDNK